MAWEVPPPVWDRLHIDVTNGTKGLWQQPRQMLTLLKHIDGPPKYQFYQETKPVFVLLFTVEATNAGLNPLLSDDLSTSLDEKKYKATQGSLECNAQS